MGAKALPTYLRKVVLLARLRIIKQDGMGGVGSLVAVSCQDSVLTVCTVHTCLYVE